MTQLDHVLDRSLVIRAERSTVFRFFTDPQRFAHWWGPGSTIESRPGGRVEIHYPGGTVAAGEVLEIVAEQRIVFSYGYVSGPVLAPGASRVSIQLSDVPQGTLLELRHAFGEAAIRDQHVAGWRYHLAVFANVVAAEQHAGLAAVADRYFAAWAEKGAPARRRTLESCVSEDVEFRDSFGCTSGRGELEAHIAASQVHMPGASLARSGEPRQCQGMALVDWKASGPGGMQLGSGTNVFQLAPDGKIARVVGFWGG